MKGPTCQGFLGLVDIEPEGAGGWVVGWVSGCLGVWVGG